MMGDGVSAVRKEGELNTLHQCMPQSQWSEVERRERREAADKAMSEGEEGSVEVEGVRLEVVFGGGATGEGEWIGEGNGEEEGEGGM